MYNTNHNRTFPAQNEPVPKNLLTNELPDLISLSDYVDNPPQPPEELIHGILRRGHKMLVAGASKAGKSFLMMELCVALSEGTSWLGFACRQSRVLYINLEIDSVSCISRFSSIYKTLGIKHPCSDNIDIWNLRGHAISLDKLLPHLIRRVSSHHFDAIIIDPIYKVLVGDENSASDMAAFTNLFDIICTKTNAAVIYCHHHSKGAQGNKRIMDRASGSGVFARDPDAQLDLMQLAIPAELRDDVHRNMTAWRMESSLREFANIAPTNFWYEFPVHKLDLSGELSDAAVEGSTQANLKKSGKRNSSAFRKKSIDDAYTACSVKIPVTLKAMANQLNVTERTVRNRLHECEDTYWVTNGLVGKFNP